MVVERLPERWRTPAVARAVTAPSAVLLGGAGMSAAILAGLAPPLAAAVGVLAWAARVAIALPRRRPEDRIEPRRVGEPWRSFVRDAQQAQRRFDATVARTRPGPLQERLGELGRRIGDGVRECWRVARQGDALEDALSQLDIDGIREERAQVEAEGRRTAQAGLPTEALERTHRAIEAQLASAERIASVARDAHDRLRLLNAQLDEAVARAVELSLGAGDVSELAPLTADVESLVVELESLRQALEETTGEAAGPGDRVRRQGVRRQVEDGPSIGA